MRRLFRRFLLLCLTAVLLVGLAVPGFAEAEENGESIKHYQGLCCIGDSTSAGYGINNFNWNDKSQGDGGGWGWFGDAPKAHFGVADNAFPGIVRDAVGADYYSMTCVGLRLVDALWILGAYEDEYDWQEAYDYHYVHQNQAARWNSMQYMHDSGEGIKNVRSSSLVLISIGANDVFTFPKNSSTINGELDFEQFAKKMVEGYERFVTCFPKLIKRVKELNPYADIYLLSQFNPYKNFTLREGGLKSVGALADTYIDNMNINTALWAKTYGATYVDVSSIADNEEEFPSLALTDEDFLNKFGRMDNHPGEVGQRTMAELILAKLPAFEVRQQHPANGINRLVFNGVNAGNFIIRRSGLGYVIRTMDGKYVNYDASADKIILSGRKDTVWEFNHGFRTGAKFTTTNYTALFKLPIHRTYTATVYLSFVEGELAVSQTSVNCEIYTAN